MHDVRGVGDERDALAHETAREAKAERERLDAGSDADRPEPQREAPLELPEKIVGRERQQRLGVGMALVPDDARPAPRIGRMANGPAGRKCCTARPS